MYNVTKVIKIAMVVFAAATVTALAIDAADTFSGKSGTLLSQIISTESTLSACPEGMIEVSGISNVSCVDRYEASPSDSCKHPDPRNAVESKENIDAHECTAVTTKGRMPWRNVTREQARELCVKSDKRLPTNEEWYLLALGTRDVDNEPVCNTESNQIAKTGEYEKCMSSQGVNDMVGNVWEWVSEDATFGAYNDRPLPESGYVSRVDSAGVAITSSATESELFNADYMRSDKEDIFGMLRGGFFAGGSDAGVYALHASILSTTAGPAIGFRCVK